MALSVSLFDPARPGWVNQRNASNLARRARTRGLDARLNGLTIYFPTGDMSLVRDFVTGQAEAREFKVWFAEYQVDQR